MLLRFEGPALTSEALAYEDLHGRSGLLSRCLCLVGTCLLGTGVAAIVPAAASTSADSTSAGGWSIRRRRQWMAHRGPNASAVDDLYGGALADDAWVTLGAHGKAPPIGSSMGVDWTLLTMCVTIVVCFVLPPLLRTGLWLRGWPARLMGQQQAQWYPGQPTAAGGQFAPQAGLAPGAAGKLFFGQQPAAPSAMPRAVEVKPGEFRGGFGGVGAGLQGFGGLDRLGGGAFGGAPPALFGGAGASATQWGSGAGAAFAPGMGGRPAGPSGLTFGGLGMGNAFGGLASSRGLGRLGEQLSGWLGGLGGRHHHAAGAGALPTEAETIETYDTYGVEMQQWTPALAAFVDAEIITPLLKELQASDEMWRQALTPKGWRLTEEAPRLAHSGVGGSLTLAGQELSVFDRNLPKQLILEPGASDLWQHRQVLESYLMHPSFEPSQRGYVLERLKEWRNRGGVAASVLRYEGRRQNQRMPSDGHILENLLVKMLGRVLEFENCFMAAAQAQPSSKHLGLPPSVFIRQVTDQDFQPRPPPHYEVVAMQRVWKLRPGTANVLQAVSLLMHLLRRQSRSYNCFPQVMRNALDSNLYGNSSSFGLGSSAQKALVMCL